MKCSPEIIRKIYNYSVHYDRQLERYKYDAMQEIAFAVLASNSEREALLLSRHLCRKLLRDFGWREPKVRERFEMFLRQQPAYDMGGGGDF